MKSRATSILVSRLTAIQAGSEHDKEAVAGMGMVLSQLLPCCEQRLEQRPQGWPATLCRFT